MKEMKANGHSEIEDDEIFDVEKKLLDLMRSALGVSEEGEKKKRKMSSADSGVVEFVDVVRKKSSILNSTGTCFDAESCSSIGGEVRSYTDEDLYE